MKHEKGKILNIWIVNVEYLNVLSFETMYGGAY